MLTLRACLAPLALCLASCSTTSNGFTVDKGSLERAFERVRNRASFEFECPKDKVELVVLNVAAGYPPPVSQVGVTGCGHKAVCVGTPDGNWIMNTSKEKAQ